MFHMDAGVDVTGIRAETIVGLLAIRDVVATMGGQMCLLRVGPSDECPFPSHGTGRAFDFGVGLLTAEEQDEMMGAFRSFLGKDFVVTRQEDKDGRWWYCAAWKPR